MYILEQGEQQHILAGCELVSEDRQAWVKEYKEKVTGRVWMEYYPHSELQGGGPRYLKEKEENTDWLILAEKHLSSMREEDWIGIVADLYPTVDEVEELVKVLEERKEKYPRKAIEILGRHLRINRGSLVGQHLGEIDNEFGRICQVQDRLYMLQQAAGGDAAR